MVLDIISICLSVCLLIVILLLYRQVIKLHRQVIKRLNIIGKSHQRVIKRFNFFMQNVQVQSNNQNDQLQPDEQIVEIGDTGESWQKQFADGFIRHLKNKNSPIGPIFMGENAPRYPHYIGFDIRRLGYVDIGDVNAFWLVVYTGAVGKIFLKLHMNNQNYFNQLKSQEAAIHRDFGSNLQWEGQGRLLRIGVDLTVNPENENKQKWIEYFEKMRVNLEKLDEVFQHRINGIFEDNNLFSSFDDEDDTSF